MRAGFARLRAPQWLQRGNGGPSRTDVKAGDESDALSTSCGTSCGSSSGGGELLPAASSSTVQQSCATPSAVTPRVAATARPASRDRSSPRVSSITGESSGVLATPRAALTPKPSATPRLLQNVEATPGHALTHRPDSTQKVAVTPRASATPRVFASLRRATGTPRMNDGTPRTRRVAKRQKEMQGEMATDGSLGKESARRRELPLMERYSEAFDLMDSDDNMSAIGIGKGIVLEVPNHPCGHQILAEAYKRTHDLASALRENLTVRELSGPGTEQYEKVDPSCWAQATYQAWCCSIEKACPAPKPDWVADREQLKKIGDEMVELTPSFPDGHPIQHAALHLRACSYFNEGKPSSTSDCMQALRDWRRAANCAHIDAQLRADYQRFAIKAEESMISVARANSITTPRSERGGGASVHSTPRSRQAGIRYVPCVVDTVKHEQNLVGELSSTERGCHEL